MSTLSKPSADPKLDPRIAGFLAAGEKMEEEKAAAAKAKAEAEGKEFVAPTPSFTREGMMGFLTMVGGGLEGMNKMMAGHVD